MKDLSNAVYFAKYSRRIWGGEPRRETWKESWDRTLDMIFHKARGTITRQEMDEIRTGCEAMEVSTSMRMFAMAGTAVEKNNICGYNCSYFAVDSIDAIVEQLIISMCGTGTGFSVERRYVDKLPPVGRLTEEYVHVIVEDSAEGWSNAYRMILEAAWRGANVTWDSSNIRAKGMPIKGRGGRSSGPECFDRMVSNVLLVLSRIRGRKCRTLEAHDIMCHTARCAAQGDVRQAACIAIFDPDDFDMLHCKDSDQMSFEKGAEKNVQRAMANNSAAWPERHLLLPEVSDMLGITFDSMRGEPGMFSRRAANHSMPQRRQRFDKDGNPIEWGPNPCVEIILRIMQFCNLSMAIIRHTDTITDVMRKVRLATILGTIQAMFTDFVGLRPQYKINCEEERLLGVDLQGHMGRPLTPSEKRAARAYAVYINQEWARRLGSVPSAAITTGKPGGGSHLLHGCTPGAANFDPYEFFIVRLRLSVVDPVAQALFDNGVPYQYSAPEDKFCFEFPKRAAPGSKTAGNVSAIEHLEEWRCLKENWTEHNPSTTVYYREEERPAIIDWVFKHQLIAGGISFYPRDDARYPLMPREEITEAEYERRMREWKPVDWSTLRESAGDATGASAERACANGACDV